MDVDPPGVEISPMPSTQGIQSLRDKLHAKMDQLRRNRMGNQPETKDELLEERRKQRGLMRDRRRKETKEKIRLEKEAKEKKGGKGDKKDNQPKVSSVPKVSKCFQSSKASTQRRLRTEPAPGTRACPWCYKCLVLCCRWPIIKQKVEEFHDNIKPIAGAWAAHCSQGKVDGHAGRTTEGCRGTREMGKGRGSHGRREGQGR